MTGRLRCLAVPLLAAAAVAACSGPAVPPAPVPPRPGTFMTGVFEPGVPRSYAPVDRFAAETGTRPRIVLWYSGLDSFPALFAAQAAAHSAIPMVQVSPGSVTMAGIAAGKHDGWIRLYAAAVRAYGKPVIIGFAAEPNGTWDQWGRGRTAPGEWIAAWRHVVTAFRAAGARNVIWLWTVNAVNLRVTSDPLRLWWPGQAYVTWAGIDGYYYRPSDTWATVFAPAVAQVRALTRDPLLISETAVGPSPSAPAQVAGLLAGARSSGCAGLVWFDEAQHDPPYHDDWHLADDPAALAAYRSAAR